MNKIKILRQFQMHDNVKLISTVKAKWLSKSYQEKFKKAIYLKYKEEEDDIEYWRKNVYNIYIYQQYIPLITLFKIKRL